MTILQLSLAVRLLGALGWALVVAVCLWIWGQYLCRIGFLPWRQVRNELLSFTWLFEMPTLAASILLLCAMLTVGGLIELGATIIS